MHTRFLRINALTRADRAEMIPRLRDAVLGSGGWITDARLFSNTSVSLHFEMSAGHVQRLRETLRALPLSLSEESRRALEDARALPDYARDGGELRGSLQVTFIHDEPDLRDEVPHIPG